MMGVIVILWRGLYMNIPSHSHSHSQNQSIRKRQHQHRRNPKYQMLKSWILSFLMDILSHKLTHIGKHVNINANGNGNGNGNGNDNVNSKTKTNSININIASESTTEELKRRKMKWTMYLLRSPIWDRVTHPLCASVGGAVGYVPLVGTPLVQYVMDLILYWQKWHFMQES
mmetsp:Transcript_17048/g.25683  ORF Transcript_17048/g.25683 Transcript_17048/m.25683 type:complete len:171 (+) Transcript_17048:622-1134(+)